MAVDLGSLRAELRIAGVFTPREGRSWLELAALGTGVAGCLVGLALTGWIGAAIFIPLAGMLSTTIAMYGHEGSHRSFSSSPTRNALLCYLAFPLFSGLGALYWRNKHDRLHHGHPNVEGVDPDIQPFPFSSSRGDHDKCGAKTRWFQRNFQKWLFWPMSTLMALGMRRSSLLYLARYKNKRERAWWIEVACLTAHYTCWIAIPSIVWGPLVGFGVYAGVWAVSGICLALVFAPAHMGLPIVNEQNHDWIHQLETTRNLELPRVMSFFFVGLDHQVEHHLFPKIPHANLARAAAITSAWCKRHDITYISEPYLAALADAMQFMSDAWNKEASAPDVVRLAS
ncbi:MAG: acyl-CoA desaturase [Kofleriaceae bacterium]|nr:acyl-CoA desaturase [Kofleriaceae bacterium]